MVILLLGSASLANVFTSPVLTAQRVDTLGAQRVDTLGRWGVDTLSARQLDTAGASVPLFTRDDAYLGAAFVVASFALRPLDRSIARRLQNPNTQTNRTLQNVATDVRLIASPGAVIIGSSLYVFGRLGHYDRVADLGLHGLEAIIVGNVLNGHEMDVRSRAPLRRW